jgi:hypothetical protein
MNIFLESAGFVKNLPEYEGIRLQVGQHTLVFLLSKAV